MEKKKAKNKKETASKSSLHRPPIVVVMGHVDHGKTTFLDYVRKSTMTAKEKGGITQTIGAYQVPVKTKEGKRLITFIDTPGHEAFSKMRSRGANIADIAILVVAADDGVMPQTREAIDHIKIAEIPLIVAINKIDLPDIHIGKVKRQLVKDNIAVEGYGGDVVAVPISAKTGKGIDELLEMILLVSEITGIEGDTTGSFSGVVIESRKDRQRGSVASLIVKQGTLKIGDNIVTEDIDGNVRNMFDEYGKRVTSAPPGKPVEILGLSDVPPVGGTVKFGKTGKNKKTVKTKSTKSSKTESVLNVVVKADSIGALEAILSVLPEDVVLVSSGVGDVSESDILFAKTTGSIIIGYRIRVLSKAVKLAELERVIIKTDDIIYKLSEEIEDVVEALKSGGLEEILGEAEVLQIFEISREKIAGVRVADGRLARGDMVKIIRDSKEIGRSRIKTLRIGKTNTNRVEAGKECGLRLVEPLDFITGDTIIPYRI